MGVSPEKQATILLSDMIGFTRRTMKMAPSQMLEFLLDYREHVQTQVMDHPLGAQYFEHNNGDATASVFEVHPSQEEDRNIRAFKTALRILRQIHQGHIAPTRFSIYSGKVIEAQVRNESIRFGNSFCAAARLRELCDFFDTPVLVDRDVVLAQKPEDRKYLACVGKITPKSFDHPVHLFAPFHPGIVEKIPRDADRTALLDYIDLKNKSIEYLHGNQKKEISPDFPKARQMFKRACGVYEGITGRPDLSSERILEWFQERDTPSPDFVFEGIKMEDKSGFSPNPVNLYRLGRELLKALDRELYRDFVLETGWQKWFRFLWRDAGETLFRYGDRADGVYFIVKGRVDVLGPGEAPIAQLGPGQIFGEMAYFSDNGRRNATVRTATETELYFICGEDMKKEPVIHRLFEKIATLRTISP